MSIVETDQKRRFSAAKILYGILRRVSFFLPRLGIQLIDRVQMLNAMNGACSADARYILSELM
jgi:hypothetical protein